MVGQKLEVIFATVPMMGHLTPLLPYAEEMLRRGHSVTVVHGSDPKYRRKLEDSGLSACKSITYEKSMHSKANDEDNDGKDMFDCLKEYYAPGTLAPRPSVIVFDFFATDAADAADSLGIPAVGVFPNLAITVNPWAASVEEQNSLKWTLWCTLFIPFMESILSRVLWAIRSKQRWSRKLPILAEQDIYPSKYMTRPMIGCTSPDIEFNAANIGSDLFTMIGPALPNSTYQGVGSELERWLDKHSDKTIVYVAFGTMFKHTRESVLDLQSELLRFGQNVAVVWSLPEKDQTDFLNMDMVPSNWRVESFFPQLALFQTGKIQAFVTHCGSNSVYEALLSGIPMVCCPGFGDQPGNAVRLARAGVGVIATKKGGVGAAVGEMLANLDVMTEASSDLRRVLESSGGGSKMAASVIESVAHGTYSPENVPRRRIPWWPFTAIGIPFGLSALRAHQ